MQKTIILEAVEYESEQEEIDLKQKWRKIKRLLNQYGIALELQTTLDEMLTQLDMSEEEYVKAVRTSLVRPKPSLKHRPCEIRINSYMKHYLQFWRANHDIQPSLTPYAMVEYMLAYVTKSQKGMSAIMEKACKEAQNGNINLKESVHGKCIFKWSGNTTARISISNNADGSNKNEQRCIIYIYLHHQLMRGHFYSRTMLH